MTTKMLNFFLPEKITFFSNLFLFPMSNSLVYAEKKSRNFFLHFKIGDETVIDYALRIGYTYRELYCTKIFIIAKNGIIGSIHRN